MLVFVDTNVLVHARDGSEPEKHRRAAEWMERLWRTGAGRTSVQVLQEYYVTVTRKLRPGLERSVARAEVQTLLAWKPVPPAEQVLERAWAVEDRYGISWWDALIVAAAEHAGCDVLLTEDLQHGQRLGEVEVVDPMRVEPARLLHG